MAQRTRKAKVVAVANRKGGVGKTFGSTQLAINAAIGGPDKDRPPIKVLFIDADSQQNSTAYFLSYLGTTVVHNKVILPTNPLCPDNEVYNLSDIFMGNDFIEYPTQCENLAIIPSDGNIDEINEEYKNHPKQKFLSAIIQTFKDLISLVEYDYDLIVIDTPPSKTHACQAAMAVSSDVLIMAQLDYFNANISVPSIIGDIDLLNQNYRDSDDPINIIGIVPNLMNSKVLDNDEKIQLTTMTTMYPQHFYPNFSFVRRVAFKTTQMPQNPKSFMYMKNKDTADQMRKFFNHIASTTLKDVYADIESKSKDGKGSK